MQRGGVTLLIAVISPSTCGADSMVGRECVVGINCKGNWGYGVCDEIC